MAGYLWAKSLPPYHAQTLWNDFVSYVLDETKNFVQKMTSIKKNEPWLHVILTNTNVPEKRPPEIKGQFARTAWDMLRFLSIGQMSSCSKKNLDNSSVTKHILLVIKFAIRHNDTILQTDQEKEKFQIYFPSNTDPLVSWQDPNNYSVIAYYRKNDSVFALILIYNASLKKQFSYHMQLYVENDEITTVDIRELTESDFQAYNSWGTGMDEIRKSAREKLEREQKMLEEFEKEILETERLVGSVEGSRTNIKGKQQEDYQKYLAYSRGNQPSDNAASNGQPPAARAASAGPKPRRRSKSAGKSVDSAQAAARSRHPANDPDVAQGPSAPPASQIRGNADPTAPARAASSGQGARRRSRSSRNRLPVNPPPPSNGVRDPHTQLYE
jgi:hypothetical protein